MIFYNFNSTQCSSEFKYLIRRQPNSLCKPAVYIYVYIRIDVLVCNEATSVQINWTAIEKISFSRSKGNTRISNWRLRFCTSKILDALACSGDGSTKNSLQSEFFWMRQISDVSTNVIWVTSIKTLTMFYTKFYAIVNVSTGAIHLCHWLFPLL